MGKISRVASQKEKEIKDEIKRKRANKTRAKELGGKKNCLTQNVKCDRKNLTQSCG